MYDSIVARMELDALRGVGDLGLRPGYRGPGGGRINVDRKGSSLIVSGSYTKYLHGHNVFTPCDDLVELCRATFEALAATLGFPVSPADRKRWVDGNIELTRVDVYRQIDVGSEKRATACAELICEYGGSRRRQEVTKCHDETTHGTTAYVGQHSRRLTLKAYGKRAETRKKRGGLRSKISRRQEIIDYATPLLRLEVTLRSRELRKRRLNRASAWRETTTKANILDERLATLLVSENVPLPPRKVEKLRRALRRAHQRWLEGDEWDSAHVTSTMRSHRSGLLAHGVDIEIPPQPRSRYKLRVPVAKLLRRPGVLPPEWSL